MKKYTIEYLKNECQKYPNRTRLKKENGKIYAAVKRRKLLDKFFRLARYQENAGISDDKVIEILKNYKSRSELFRFNPNIYFIAKRRNLLEDHLKMVVKRWNLTSAWVACQQIKDYRVFRHTEGLYRFCLRNDLIEHYSSHMKKVNKSILRESSC